MQFKFSKFIYVLLSFEVAFSSLAPALPKRNLRKPLSLDLMKFAKTKPSTNASTDVYSFVTPDNESKCVSIDLHYMHSGNVNDVCLPGAGNANRCQNVSVGGAAGLGTVRLNGCLTAAVNNTTLYIDPTDMSSVLNRMAEGTDNSSYCKNPATESRSTPVCSRLYDANNLSNFLGADLSCDTSTTCDSRAIDVRALGSDLVAFDADSGNTDLNCTQYSHCDGTPDE